MGDNSKIEWCDATWNPIAGCSPISPGCTHCYAASMALRLEAMAKADIAAGKDPGGKSKYIGTAERRGRLDVFTGKINVDEAAFEAPLKWRKPRRIFVNSTSDLFHEAIDTKTVFRILDVCVHASYDPGHVMIVLTKRADRMRDLILEYLDDGHRCGAGGFCREVHGVKHSMPAGVWLGVSVEDQARADQRRSPLAAIAERGCTTFVSYEPALGPVDWTGWEYLNWLVSGGESGQGARLSELPWHQAARDFCAGNSIAYHFKQWGAWCPFNQLPDDTLQAVDLDRVGCETRGEHSIHRVGKKAAGRLLDGVEHNGFPVVEEPA